MAKKQAKIKNLAENEELSRQFLQVVDTEFSRIKSLREQFEDTWEAADYMYKAAQNRALNQAEKSRGVNDPDDTRANLGSTLFFRQVTQIASEGVAVELSREAPFKFNPIITPDVEHSHDKARSEAEQLNVLAKYTMKHDKYRQKAPDFWTMAGKYGNVPIMVQWDLRTKMIKRAQPTYNVEVGEDGEEAVTQTGTQVTEQEIVVRALPTIRILNLSSIFADPYIGNLQDQSCVVIQSVVHKADIYNEVRNGIYSEEVYEELTAQDKWDGQAGMTFKQKQIENRDLSWEANEGVDQYLKWDIYFRAPIDGDNWDETAVPVWYYAVVIGNEIGQGKLMTIMRNPDPDDEVPIEMVHLYPDDADTLYHVAPADIIRSNYSAECTLKNLAIDNMALVNRPPLMALEGAHFIKDFTFKSGATWSVQQMDAVQQMAVRDNTQQTVGLLEYLKQETQQALATDKNRLGENFGSRTTATEANNIMSLSSQPSLTWISYVLNQKLGFYARKLMSLWRTFGTPSVIHAITDMALIPNVEPTEMAGEFDVQIDVMDEYKDDMVSQQVILGFVRMIAQAPQLLQSEYHTVDLAELMKDIFFKAGMNGDKYVKTPQGGDSWRMAEMENIAMMENGQAAQIHPDDNDSVHMRAHKAYKLKYSGIEDITPNMPLLDTHIAEHEAAMMQGTSPSLSGQQDVQGQDQVAGVGQDMAGMNAGVA